MGEPCEHWRHQINDSFNPHSLRPRDDPRRFTCSGCGAIVEPRALLAQQMRFFHDEAPELYHLMVTKHGLGERFPEIVVGDSTETH